MCRDGLKLPSQYTAANVLGVTKGRERWTIYFTDGARFTQCHNNPANLGFKAPEPHHCFENVPDWVLNPMWEKAKETTGIGEGQNPTEATKDAFFDAICKEINFIKEAIRDGKIVRPERPQQADEDDPQTLVEVKKVHGGVTVHTSSSQLEPVEQAEAEALIAILRARSTDTAPNNATENWYFVEKDDQPDAPQTEPAATD